MHAAAPRSLAAAAVAAARGVRLTGPNAASAAAACRNNHSQAQLKELGRIGACPRDLACIATGALARWQLASMAPLGASHLLAGVSAWLAPLSSRPAAVAGMPALQLGLLVAAQRLEDQGHATFNFEVRGVRPAHAASRARASGAAWRSGRMQPPRAAASACTHAHSRSRARA